MGKPGQDMLHKERGQFAGLITRGTLECGIAVLVGDG